MSSVVEMSATWQTFYRHQRNSKKPLLCDFLNLFLTYDKKASYKFLLKRLLSLLKNKIYEGVFEHLKWRDTLIA